MRELGKQDGCEGTDGCAVLMEGVREKRHHVVNERTNECMKRHGTEMSCCIRGGQGLVDTTLYDTMRLCYLGRWYDLRIFILFKLLSRLIFSSTSFQKARPRCLF